jgi:hypothetical protein
MLSLAPRNTSGHVVLQLATSGWGTPSEQTLEAIRSELRSLGASLLLSRSDDAQTSLSLLAPDGSEAFRIAGGATDVAAALLEALQIAAQSARLPDSRAIHSQGDVVFYSLVGALSLVFSDGWGATSPPRTAEALAS